MSRLSGFFSPALTGLLIAAIVAAVSVIANNYLLQAGTSLAMAAVLCLSWNLVGGYMGYPSLATATLFGLGAYAGAVCQIQGVPLELSWLAAALTGAIFSGLLGLVLLGLRGHYFAIGTIATIEVMREIASNWDAVTGGAIGMNLPMIAGSPDQVSRFFYLSMWALVGVALLTTLIVDRTSFGFALRCIRQNERAASMVGIDVFRYKIAAFTLSGMLAAASGAVYASMIGFIEPKDAFNLTTSIEVPVMVLLGGAGNIIGPLVGAILFVVLNEYVWANFINYHTAILGLIIMVVVYLVPAGILGALRKVRLGRLRSVQGMGGVITR